MKRILLVTLIIAALSLAAGFAVPIFAHGPTEGDSGTPDQEAWEAMHEACEDGNWEEMAEAGEEVHGEDFSTMPCHDEGQYPSDEGGHMGGGHMGGSWGGMMGW